MLKNTTRRISSGARSFVARLWQSLFPNRYAAVVLLASGAIMLLWFRGYILYQWDETFPFNPLRDAQAYVWPWSDIISTGVPLLVSKDLSYFGLIYFFNSLLGLSLLDSEILLYYLLFVMGGFSMYFFFLHQSQRDETSIPPRIRYGALVASILYMFNAYWMVYVWQIFSEEAFLYATLPIFLLLFQKLLSSSTRIGTIKVILGLSVTSIFASPVIGDPSFLIPLAIGLLIFCLVSLVHPPKAQLRRNSLLRLLWATTCLVFVNMWWLVPEGLLYESQLVRASGSIFPQASLPDLVANSANSNYANVIRLAGLPPFYRTSIYPHYSFAWVYQLSFIPLTAISLAMATIAISALLIRRHEVRHSSVLFAAISIIGVIPLVAGTQPPFGSTLEWIIAVFPPFATVFRDPYQKFGFWLAFSYPFLIGVTAVHIMGRAQRKNNPEASSDRKKSRRSYRRFLSLLWILILILGPIYAWPMVTGDVIPNATSQVPAGRIQVPSYYFDAASWLESQDYNYRVLSLPEDQILQSSNWTNGYAGQDILRYLTGYSIISTDPQVPELTSFQGGVYQYIYDGGQNFTRVLSLMNVNFVLLRMDAGFYPAVTQFANLTMLHSFLDSQPDLHLEKQFGPLLFYALNSPGPLVFATSNVLTLSEINSIGWNLSEYLGGWNLSSATLLQTASGLTLTTHSPGSYSYGYATTAQNVGISTIYYPYIKVQFETSPNAALLLRVNFDTESNVWLAATDLGNASVYGGTQYSSVTPTTLLYNLETLPGHVVSIDIFVTNDADPASTSNATVTINDLTFESVAGLPQDYARAIAEVGMNSFSYVITESTPPGNFQQNLSPSISWTKLSSVLYEVQIQNARSPFVLVLTETFDPSWTLDGSSLSTLNTQHIMVDGFANGWVVYATGNFSVSIHYGPYQVYEVAYLASSITLTILVALFLVAEKQRGLKKLPKENIMFQPLSE